MAGTNIENALKEVATAVKDSDTTGQNAMAVGTMGIRGALWNNVAQLTATTILCGSFLYLGREYIVQGREKDLIFREELKAMRQTQVEESKLARVAQEQRWEKTDATHGRSMEKMGATIERAVGAMEDAAKELRNAGQRIRPAIIPP